LFGSDLVTHLAVFSVANTPDGIAAIPGPAEHGPNDGNSLCFPAWLATWPEPPPCWPSCIRACRNTPDFWHCGNQEEKNHGNVCIACVYGVVSSVTTSVTGNQRIIAKHIEKQEEKTRKEEEGRFL